MSFPITTIPASVAVGNDFVLVPKREYDRLTKGRSRSLPTFIGYESVVWKGKKHSVPSYQLHGKAAERLDMRVREGMREYRAGETISASSVDEALHIYARKKNKKN